MHTSAPPSSTAPSLVRVVLFRYAFVYWTFIVLLLCANEDTGLLWFGKLIGWVWNPVLVWVGKHVLGISYELQTGINGSGDKTSDWVGVFLAAAAAVIATLVWTLVERRGAHHERLRALLRVVLRYTLAFALLGYGMSKVFGLQFSAPSGARLLQRYGDSSPMGLLWTFMGASPTYEIFAGAAEVLGAVLLLFRRTTALGALTLAVVLVNVVLLNFCYDVPVKINSAHYLGMCVFLMLPVLGRLANVLWFNRPTQPTPREPSSPDRRRRWARRLLKYGVIGFVVVQDLRGELRWLDVNQSSTWYSGYWNVTAFSRDGQAVPAIITDQTRWRRIRFQLGSDANYLRWRFMDDSYGALFTCAFDEQRHVIVLTAADADPATQPIAPITLHYARTDPDHLTLEGQVGTEALSVQLERLEPEKMLLVTRGFHWINETPFNR